MRNLLILISLLLLSGLKSCNALGDVHGVLTLENQSNHDISIAFYGGNRYLRLLTDSVFLNKNGGTWQKHYKERGSLNPFTVFINQHADSIPSVDSIRVIYSNQRLRIHPAGFRTEDQEQNYKQLTNTNRHLMWYESYAIKREKTSIGCKTGEENYRYTFTNADYEAAKPIDP